jgi:MFS family permease
LIGGVTADLFVPQERGLANSIAAVGIIFGPIIGPLCGGFIAQRAGWRWIFWVLLIASATVGALLEIFNRESYAPVLIARRTIRLRKELNRPELHSCYDDEDHPQTPSEKFKQAMTRPLRMLFLSPIIAICSFYVAIIYGELYLLLTTVSSIYESSYHWAPELTGLATLGIGVGSLAGVAFVGSTSDKTVAVLTRKNNGVYEPEMRLPSMIFFAVLIPISFFWYGWTAEKGGHWIVPILAQIPFGLGIMGIAFPIQIYLIDAFSLHAASAMAALTVSRSLFGALLPLPAPRMYEVLGLGWGNSILGFLALVMAPVPYFLWKFGGKIRKEHPIML